jgi:hypothetical protein
VSRRVSESGWGKSVVKDFSDVIQSHYASIKGFSPQNIWRMKQFYETYRGNEKLSPLVREISWTNNILIMMAAKTDEERELERQKEVVKEKSLLEGLSQGRSQRDVEELYSFIQFSILMFLILSK